MGKNYGILEGIMDKIKSIIGTGLSYMHLVIATHTHTTTHALWLSV